MMSRDESTGADRWPPSLAVAHQTVASLPAPAARRLPARDRLEGMLLGLAIGDALGNTSEGQLPSQRRRAHGEIRDYLPNRHADGRTVGLPSDDTQLAFWTLEHLLAHGRIEPGRYAAMLGDGRRIFGMGRTVREFLRALAEGGPWWRAAQRSAGNGALMRIAPVLLPHLRRPSPSIWEDAALGGAVTHDDPTSIGACIAWVAMLWDALAMERPPARTWWLDRYCALARGVEGEARLAPRHPTLRFEGPSWRLVDTVVREALEEDLAVLDACERWYSGAFLLETVPSALYILARHGDDPEEAIVRAVNDTKDNDTLAAIVGATVGALHGRSGLPARWIDGLLGRTNASDDGRVFELIERALDRWS